MKKKKAPRKLPSKSSDLLIITRSVIALLIVLLAFSVLVLFSKYKQNIMENNSFVPFMILTTIGLGLLVSLLFLINPARKK